MVRSPTFRTIFFFRSRPGEGERFEDRRAGLSILTAGRSGADPLSHDLHATPEMPVTLMTPAHGLEYWKVLSEALANGSVEDRDRFFMAMKFIRQPHRAGQKTCSFRSALAPLPSEA